MPSSMCWPFGENSQLKVEGMRSLLNVSASFSRANRPRRLTHGPRLVETVTSGEVVTMRSASVRLLAAELVEQRAEARLRRHRRLDRDRQAAPAPERAARVRRRAPCRERHAGRGRPAARRAAMRRPSNRSHSCPGRTCIAWRRAFHLRRRHQAGVIVLVAGERQAEALDGVGDEADRPVVVDACRRPRAATAGRGRRDWSSAARARRRSGARSAASPDPGRRARRAGACATPRRPGRPAPSRAGSGSCRSSARKRSPPGSRERRLQQRAVFEDHHVPAEGSEQRLDSAPTGLRGPRRRGSGGCSR